TVIEPAAAGYSTSYNNCSNVAITNGGTQTCTITNNDIAPTLTLTKFVNNGGINDPALPPTSFVVGTSGGPTHINGAGGVASGTNFSAGTYTLGETGPTGYTASAWSCTGATLVGSTIKLDVAQNASCWITNTLQNIPPKLGVTKSVTPKNLTTDGGTVTF